MIDEMTSRVAEQDWYALGESLTENGYALAENVIPHEICEQLINGYSDPEPYRKTVVMERYRFGLGEYKYFSYPLPELLHTLREIIYPHLSPVANRWMKALNVDKVFPATHEALRLECAAAGQTKPAVLILKYGPGGFNTLHQDLYGEVYFPLQLVLFLNEPGQDYAGGEFVLTEQLPRAQSKATVLTPRRGDMLLFTTNFRPVRGSKGYYRVNMRHGVSPVHWGARHTLGLIFHDAAM